jgi:hypothetical protein
MRIHAGLALLLAVGRLAAQSADPVPTPPPAPNLAEVRAARDAINAFLEQRMTDPATGAVYVNAVNDRPVVAGEARNHEVLSEAVGQMMELALLRGDRALFERQVQLINSRFLDPASGFLAWKIRLEPPSQADTSATLDDWRVVWAGLLADRRWKMKDAAKLGTDLAGRLVTGSEGMVIPPPAFNLGGGSPGSGAVLLCYLHLPAMDLAAGVAPGARRIYDDSLAVLRGIDSAPGMVPARWDPATRQYATVAADEVLALITLLYLQEMDPGNQRLADAIRVRSDFFRENGRLPQAFDPVSGRAVGDPAGASVYALWIRLLLAAGRPFEEAGPAVARMLEFQNGPDSPFPGAIGGYPVFSFDQLEVLLALEAYLQAAKK